MKAEATVPGAEAMPLVSVLIPAFNHERYVERCLDSVLEDPYPAKELVVIDDGSTDATRERIARWIALHGNELPVRFEHRANRGIAATLNDMVRLAQGEFLRLGASDDYLLPGGLDAQVRYLRAHPHKAAVIGDAIVVDGEGTRLHESSMHDLYGADKRRYRTDESIRREVISHWAVSSAVTLVRKNAPEVRAGWNEQLRIEDWDFFLSLVARDALGFIDLRVCAYRLHGGNTSKTPHVATRIVNLTDLRRVARRHIALFDEPHRTLLRAQSHYIAAKIAYLRMRPGSVALHLLAYAWMSVRSRLRWQVRAALAEKKA